MNVWAKKLTPAVLLLILTKHPIGAVIGLFLGHYLEKAISQKIQEYKTQQHTRTGLKQAYQLLGVSGDTSEENLKKVYRKLMSQYHPDKLIAAGRPESEIQQATEQIQRIQSAYDLILKVKRGQ